jgi:hypothetical protein
VTLSPAQRGPLGARLRDALRRNSGRSARDAALDESEGSAQGE